MPEEPPYISVLDQLRIPDQPAKVEGEPAKDPKEELAKAEKQEPEKKPEPVKPEPEKKTTRAPSTEAGKENFATVTANWKNAEKKAADLEQQLQERQKKITEMELQLAELPPTKEAAARLQAQIQEKEAALETLNQEFQRSREELKAVGLERTPEFVEKFDKPRDFQVGQLRDLAAGNNAVSEADVMRAVKDRNYQKLFEIREQLEPYQQPRWDGILRIIEEIDLKKEQELADSEKAWERLQEDRRKLAMKSHAEKLEAHRAIGSEIITKLRDNVDFFRDDKELQQTVSEIVEGVAGGKGAEKWTPEAILGVAAAVPILNKINAAQAKMIEDGKTERETLVKERDELKKKVADQEEFIKKRYGSVDFRQPAAKETNGDYDPERPIHEQLAIRRS